MSVVVKTFNVIAVLVNTVIYTSEKVEYSGCVCAVVCAWRSEGICD